MKECCLVCKSEENLSDHHLVPQRFGGTLQQGKVVLCRACHDLVDYTGLYSCKSAQKILDAPHSLLRLIIIRLHADVAALKGAKSPKQVIRHQKSVLEDRVATVLSSAQRLLTDPFDVKARDKMERTIHKIQAEQRKAIEA